MSDDKTSVTSHNQSGGITAHTVNIGALPRILDPVSAQQLTNALPARVAVEVVSVWGDQEAFQFATQVKNYLVGAGYTVSGVHQAMFNQPVLGQVIENQANQNKVIIGARQ